MHAYATYRNIFIEKKKTAIRPPKTSKELDHLINNASEKIAEYEAMSILTMAGIQTQRGSLVHSPEEAIIAAKNIATWAITAGRLTLLG